jgi:hypothetical protein
MHMHANASVCDGCDSHTDLDQMEIALVVAEAPQIVPWMSRLAHLEALVGGLRFANLPVSWKWRPAVEKPASTDELVAKLIVERDVGRRHLATVTASLHDRDWRREHCGGGIYPEDHLRWTTAGFLDLDDASRRLEPLTRPLWFAEASRSEPFCAGAGRCHQDVGVRRGGRARRLLRFFAGVCWTKSADNAVND